jgi:hypothetical protein
MTLTSPSLHDQATTAVIYNFSKSPVAPNLSIRETGDSLAEDILSALRQVEGKQKLQARYRIQQFPRIGMLRVIIDLIRRCLLNDLAFSHHQHLVADMLYHR